MTHCFNTVSVRIQNESCIVIGVILETNAGLSIVSSPGSERLGMESPHCFTVGRAKAHVHTPQGRHADLCCNCKLHTQLPGFCTIVRAAPLKIHCSDNPERSQDRIIESPAALQVAHS